MLLGLPEVRLYSALWLVGTPKIAPAAVLRGGPLEGCAGAS